MNPPGDFFEDEALGRAFDGRLMKRLLVYLGPHRLTIFSCVAALLLAAALQTLPIRLIGTSFDLFIVRGDARGLGVYALIMAAAIAAQFVINRWRTFAMARVGQKVVYVMRTELFAHLQKMSLSFFDRNPVGRLMTRVGNDIETLSDFFADAVVGIFSDLFVVCAVIVWLFTINAELAAVTMLVLPPAFALSFWFRSRARSCYRNTRMRLARVNAYFQENIAGMRLLQVFNRQGRNRRRFADLNEDLNSEWRRTISYYARFFPLMELISQACTATVVIYGGWYMVRPGNVTPGDLISFILLTRMFYQPIQNLSSSYDTMQSAMASSERIFKILDTRPAIAPRPSAVALAEPIRRIEFRGVRFSYTPGKEVLRGVSFAVERGQTVALVGATGAGKSTIVNLLCRFWDVDGGQVLVNDLDVRRLDLLSLRRRMAVVPQDVFLFSGTAADNIRLGERGISDEQVRRAARLVNADRFIESIPGAYQGRIAERGASVSTGQRQLLSFARAITFEPDLLILDEATSSVDTETEALIQGALARLMEGRTSIVIAHRLSTIQRADLILVMHKGEIRETGTHQELLRKGGIYRTLYELQYKDQQVL